MEKNDKMEVYSVLYDILTFQSYFNDIDYLKLIDDNLIFPYFFSCLRIISIIDNWIMQTIIIVKYYVKIIIFIFKIDVLNFNLFVGVLL